MPSCIVELKSHRDIFWVSEVRTKSLHAVGADKRDENTLSKRGFAKFKINLYHFVVVLNDFLVS